MKIRPVGLATLLGGIVGSLLIWWITRKGTAENPQGKTGR